MGWIVANRSVGAVITSGGDGRRAAAAPGRREGQDARMSTAITIYGIRSCDTMRKARAWLDERGIAYAFHDYRTQGIDRSSLGAWVREVGWGALLNRSGTTFRKLADAEKEGLSEARAIALMLAYPSAIRRPVLTAGGTILVGFDAARYAALLVP
jgi:arsenate reductase